MFELNSIQNLSVIGFRQIPQTMWTIKFEKKYPTKGLSNCECE